MTFLERIGNLFSFGAVAKYKIEAAQLKSEYRFWTQQNDRLIAENDRLIADGNKWYHKATKRREALTSIVEMGTENMAHIGKKMQAEALKGLGQENP